MSQTRKQYSEPETSHLSTLIPPSSTYPTRDEKLRYGMSVGDRKLYLTKPSLTVERYNLLPPI